MKKYDELYVANKQVWTDGPGRILEKIPPVIKKGKVLDLGCGDGKNSFYLESQGYDVTGVDISTAAIDRIKLRFKKNGVEPKGNYYTQDIMEMKPGDYDILVSYGIYHDLHKGRLEKHKDIQKNCKVLAFCSFIEGIPLSEKVEWELPTKNEILELIKGWNIKYISESVIPGVLYPDLFHNTIWVLATK